MLETKRCFLDTVHKSDYKNIKELYVNAAVRKYLGGPREEESMKAVIKDMLSPRENRWYWIIRIERTKMVIGLVLLDPNDVNQEVIRYAFHELKDSKLIVVT
ncbi:GNAT family N-acetyltransferase [Bacillus thuringiensis]|uniref:GNAT family N-acetyltransferase n=1 Tax=Bacillus thuringiensis TaxID=1428 RepID=UPI002015EF24|nr:GNAT family N-acetyltransferase [Bacillus thuringiensis]MDA1668175.1 GNAT family N-acetyltransferase [Bacillus cereus]MDA1768112.1 GNAT family N-acetyltransferase [Bacillus cereus]MEC2867081.1 GNAT family N-acetyltransferase [Bacillus cereus]